MKKLFFAAIFVFSQLAFSQVREVRRMTDAQARERIEKSATYREIEEAKRTKDFDITKSPALLEKVTKVVELVTKDVVTLSGTEMTNVIKLMNVDSLNILAEVTRLSSIVKDPSTSAQERASAKKSIELIAKSAHTVNSLVKSTAEAQAQQQKITKIIQISSKISALEFGQSSKTFVEKYEKALTEGKDVDEAVKIASNGKFTEKELRECE